MGWLKKQKESYTKWKAESPAREQLRIETAKRRLEMERQRANIMKQRTMMAKAQAETRKYSQQFRNSGFGGAMSMQPSGISSPSYFAPTKAVTIKPKIVRRKVSRKKRSRTKSKKPSYIIRGGKAYRVG